MDRLQFILFIREVGSQNEIENLVDYKFLVLFGMYADLGTCNKMRDQECPEVAFFCKWSCLVEVVLLGKLWPVLSCHQIFSFFHWVMVRFCTS